MVVLGRGRGRGSTKNTTKVAAPLPINLPSLKSENLGLDPNISLVPVGGSGWGSKPEDGPVEEAIPPQPKEEPATKQEPSTTTPPSAPTHKEEAPQQGSNASVWSRPVEPKIEPDRRGPNFQLTREEFPSLGEQPAKSREPDYNLRPQCMYYALY